MTCIGLERQSEATSDRLRVEAERLSCAILRARLNVDSRRGRNLWKNHLDEEAHQRFRSRVANRFGAEPIAAESANAKLDELFLECVREVANELCDTLEEVGRSKRVLVEQIAAQAEMSFAGALMLLDIFLEYNGYALDNLFWKWTQTLSSADFKFYSVRVDTFCSSQGLREEPDVHDFRQRLPHLGDVSAQEIIGTIKRLDKELFEYLLQVVH